MTALPPFALFPDSAAWRQQIGPTDWALYLSSWRALAAAYLALPDAAFAAALANDEQTGVSSFLVSLARALVEAGPAALAPYFSTNSGSEGDAAAALKKSAFLLTARALRLPKPPPPALLSWEHLSDVSRVYGRRRTGHVLAKLPPASVGVAEASLSALKKYLIKNMEEGSAGKGDVRAVESRLLRVNYLISAWPAAGALLLTGSDYLDGLAACFVIMNPPLRRAIVTNLYVSLIGLTEPPTPRYSLLSDLLYALRAAAEEHKKGPLRPSDSLVAELVSVTPLLQQIQQRAEAPSSSGSTGAGTSTNRILPILKDLAKFKKPGSGLHLPPGRLKRKLDKGKAAAPAPAPVAVPSSSAAGAASSTPPTLHPHKLSQIAVVQDLFPDLGSAFVAKLLDEYNDDTEQVVACLLEDNLPPHLVGLDRTENLGHVALSDAPPPDNQHTSMAPHATPPLPPSQRNIFDNDELDSLSLETSKLHFGKSKAKTTADDLLADRSSSKAPNKAAIWSALAAFDSDDDERDDTYDAVDVGGTVDNSVPAGSGAAEDLHAANEQTLYAAYMATPDASVFQRDAFTRRSQERAKLREETGMTDEALEGWAMMLARNPQQRRRLELQSSAFGGEQTQLERTSWRAGEDDEEDGAPSRGGFRGRGRGGPPRGGGRGRGNVAGPTGDKDTQQARNRKEANKGSRANHNRRDQRAKKMARGGFPG
ncbi:hypothetical protein Sste5346_007118 [Sporothrix stenoceras]|uniref:CUE domain-containing protein n=1 Tax=Sporothrix stenoceras TaxID=5173 RepID=A0ABR3YX04_9PEZI